MVRRPSANDSVAVTDVFAVAGVKRTDPALARYAFKALAEPDSTRRRPESSSVAVTGPPVSVDDTAANCPDAASRTRLPLPQAKLPGAVIVLAPNTRLDA